MSIPEIPGIPTDPGENDPVEVRRFQIEGTTLESEIGFPVSPNFTNRIDFPSERRFWQYFSSGMIVSSFNTCAQVLFGPILDYYATANQFAGPLKCPSTDVTQLSDGTSFAAFEQGVLWLDGQGTVNELVPVDPLIVKAFSNIDPTPAGIAAFAQTKIASMAAQEIQNDPQLKDNVDNVVATVVFENTGSGGCAGASLQNAGRSLLLSHIFKVHLDFKLKGCGGVFGNASADLHITIRLAVTPPNVAGFLESFNIDAVSSPFGAADSAIESGLSNALYAQQGVDLVGVTLPAGVVVLAAIVDTAGNVNIYIEPLCMSSSILRRVAQPEAETTLAVIRRLRDNHLLRKAHGKQFTQLVDSFGPVLTEAIRAEEDAAELRGRISQFLLSHFHEGADLKKLAAEITEPSKRAVSLLNAVARNRREGDIERLRAKAVQFIREEVSERASFDAVMASLSRILKEEMESIRRRGGAG